MQKELLIDLETSPNLAYVWEKYEQDVIAFKKERELLSFAYKWSGERKVHTYCLKDHTPFQLTKKLHDLFNEADTIVGHNVRKFDIKMANAFFVRFHLKPTSPYKTIDTLEIARNKFRFNSNKLNDLAQYLGIGQKVETGGFKLWLECLKGNGRAWKRMREYNKQDVVLLEKVLLILRPWSSTPTNQEGIKCPACGSVHIQKRGWSFNRVFKNRRYQCSDCGRWSSSNKKVKYNSEEYLI